MKSRKPALKRIAISLVALGALALQQIQPASAEKKLPLPKSADALHKTTAMKLTEALNEASTAELKKSVMSLTRDQSVSAEDWQKFLAALRDSLNESNDDREKLQNELCIEILEATNSRFGKGSVESSMAHLTYAVSLAVIEEGRKAWNEYDEAVSSGKLAASNPDFLVKSLEMLGFNFRKNFYDADTLHAFQLADKFVDNHKVSLPVKADLYNTGTEQLYRCDSEEEGIDSLFYKYADRAISLDQKLGSKYAKLLESALDLKNNKRDWEIKSSAKTKEFKERREAHLKSLEKQ